MVERRLTNFRHSARMPFRRSIRAEVRCRVGLVIETFSGSDPTGAGVVGDGRVGDDELGLSDSSSCRPWKTTSDDVSDMKASSSEGACGLSSVSGI